MKHRKVLPHFCNEPTRCPECFQHFWLWYEQHTNAPSREERESDVRPSLSFYEAAARKVS